MTEKWIFGNDVDALADAHKIRRIVFMGEQNVSEEEEMIAWEDEISTHLVLYLEDGTAVATGRVMAKDGSHILGRIAVLKEFRGRHFGKMITQRLVEKSLKMGAVEVVLSSQTHAKTFYEQLGFTAFTDVYMDAGIPHVSMKLTR